MADLRIVDAPEIPTENITGEEKLPTGGNGNYSISLDSLADYTKTKKDLADNTSVDGKVNGVRQELDGHIEDLLNPHQVTKGQIGLGNVDNTADADKPVSNSTQAAIISAVTPKADKTYVDNALSSKSDKTYVDNQLTLKANKTDVYTKSETYTKQESNDLVTNSVSTALTPVNSSLDLAKRGIANRYDPLLTYNSGERVVLTNGDIVKSTINGNTNDPNVDMTGWKKPQASEIFDESGKTQQQINNLFLSRFASIEDFGASESATREVNTAAINTALTAFKRVYVPDGKSYPVNLNGIFLNTNNYLFGSGELVGPDHDAMMADVSGQMIRVDNCTGVVVTDVKIKNGYKGKGVWMTNSRNIEFNNFTVDGYSYGMWIGENDDGVGCSDIRINQPRILNTKYWGMYVRCLDVVVEANKTQKVTINDPYFYNANMAAFVCAEGHVKHVTLVNPVFERCNVDMHFESCSNYTVINPTSIDTGKKPDHLPANVEYPFVGWSLYEIFTQNSKVLGGNLDSTVWLGAGSDAKSWNHEYIGLTCKEFVFEGVGEIQDLSKDFFKGYTFSSCTTTGVLIYQQTDAPLSYLRDFKIVDCSCLLGESGNSGSGSFISLNPDRAVNWKVVNNGFKNSAVRIRCEKTLVFKGNTFDGTDDTQSRLDGVSGVLGSGSFLDFSGNTFQSAGGAVFPDSAILIKNWSVARVDNVVACNGTQRGYRFTDNFRIEFGAGLIYNDTVEKYTDSGTSAFVFLYRA